MPPRLSIVRFRCEVRVQLVKRDHLVTTSLTVPIVKQCQGIRQQDVDRNFGTNADQGEQDMNMRVIDGRLARRLIAEQASNAYKKRKLPEARKTGNTMKEARNALTDMSSSAALLCTGFRWKRRLTKKKGASNL